MTTITPGQQRTLYRLAAFIGEYDAVVDAALAVYRDYMREMAEKPGPKQSVDAFTEAAEKAQAAIGRWTELIEGES